MAVLDSQPPGKAGAGGRGREGRSDGVEAELGTVKTGVDL